MKNEDGGSLVNRTCTLHNPPPNFFAGNAAFMKSRGELTGFEFSGNINIVSKWLVSYRQTEAFNDALDASLVREDPDKTFHWHVPAYEKCAPEMRSFYVTCRDNPNNVGVDDIVIMMTNQHENSANNYAIANYGEQDNVITVALGTQCSSVEPLDIYQDSGSTF